MLPSRGRLAGGFRLLAALTIGLLLASCARPEKGRVLLLGLDGLDPDEVSRLVAEGRLPNFAKLAGRGAVGRATSLRPYLSPLLWTTIATGRKPLDHGITSFTVVDPATGIEVPMPSTARKVKAVWNIASDAGRKAGVVGWWATWPPEPVNGFVVSDRVAYHFLSRAAPGGATALAGAVWPPELAGRVEGLVRRPSDIGRDELLPFADVPEDELERPLDFREDVSHVRWALAAAESTRAIGLELWETQAPDVLLLYVEAPDTISHLFGHLHRRPGLSGELAEQARRWSGAVEAAYAWSDRLVGEALSAVDKAGPDATLVVVSDHGFALGVLPDDPAVTRDPHRASEAYHRPEAFLAFAGGRVRPSARIGSASLLDVAPTVLALLGLPASREMPGRVLSEAFEGLSELGRVASYGAAKPVTAPRPVSADPEAKAAVDHLRNLGYLGGPAAVKADRNLAALHLEEGHYREAAAIYAQLAAQDPEDVASRSGLAMALAGAGRYADALTEAARVLTREPMNVGALQVRGVALEKLGRRDEAVESYRAALRYRPDYGPSRRALLRLTGSEAVRTPAVLDRANVARVASGLAEATAAVSSGDYPRALRLLDEIEPLAPSAVEIHQTRANAAYLMGDRALAARALRRALEIEPDNALFRRNLGRLERTK